MHYQFTLSGIDQLVEFILRVEHIQLKQHKRNPTNNTTN